VGQLFKRWALNIYVALLLFTPLAFGTTELWSMAVVQLLCAISLLLFAVEQKKTDSPPVVRVPGLLPLLALAGLLCFQLLPLPPGVLHLISPTTAELYQHSVYVLAPEAWLPISVNVQATIFELLRFLTGVTLYFLTVQYFTALSSLKKLLEVLAWFFGGYAFLSLLQYLIPNDYIFWFIREWPQRRPHAFGTYVNGNHYAGLIEMILPLMLALFLVSRPRVSYLNWRQKIVDFFKCPSASQYILFGVVVVLLAGTVFLSLSRGGIISTSLSLLAFALVLLVKSNRRKTGVIVLVLMVVIFSLVGHAGWEPIFDRFDRITNSAGELADERLVYWQDSLQIIRDYPLFGSGAGSFIDIYPHYRTTVNTTYTVDHAHNDYVEFLVTLGIIGFLLLGCFMWSLLRQTYHVWRQRQNSFSTMIWLGSMFGLFALLLHSVTDFNLYIGANAFYFFVLCGIAVAAAYGQSSSRAPGYFVPMAKTSSRLLIALLALAVVTGSAFNGVASYVDLRYAAISAQDVANPDAKQAQQLTAELVSLQALVPWDAKLSFALANVALTQQDLSTAADYYQRALKLHPLNGEYAQALGLLRSYQGQGEQAQTLLQAGITNDPTQAQRYLTYIVWLLTAQRNDEAKPWIRAALTSHPQCFAELTLLFAIYGLNDQDMLSVLPAQSAVQVKFGDYLLRRGKQELAEQVFKRALALTASEKRPSTTALWRLHKLYRQRGDNQSGIALLNHALTTFPGDADMHANLARLYEREGIRYRALEEYQQAYLLAPSKEWVKKALERLQR